MHTRAHGAGSLSWQLLGRRRTQSLGADGGAGAEEVKGGGAGFWRLRRIRYKTREPRRCQTANGSVGVGEKRRRATQRRLAQTKDEGRRGSEAARGAVASLPHRRRCRQRTRALRRTLVVYDLSQRAATQAASRQAKEGKRKSRQETADDRRRRG